MTPRKGKTPTEINDMVHLYMERRWSIRRIAQRHDLSYQGVRMHLLAAGTQLRAPGCASHVQDTGELAAQEHTMRRALVALRGNGTMYETQLVAISGTRSVRDYLRRLADEGHVTMEKGPDRRCRYWTLTPQGHALLTTADILYDARQPAMLAARRDNGESTSSIARDVGLSEAMVIKRLEEHDVHSPRWP